MLAHLMADPRRRLASNAPGPLFVDDTCIDCGTCRWMAPEVFDRLGGASRVHTQPEDPRPALQALVACPTGSIGARPRPGNASRDFPRVVHPGLPEVLHCGFHAESSFGAASWLILRPEGNVLVDSPRYNRILADRLGELGGVRWMFLTHRDDIADHDRWAAELGCERVMNRRDLRGETVEHAVEGDGEITNDLRYVATPGHTEGSHCLLFGEALFTGDHLAWSHGLGHLHAFRGACWYSWPEQIRSMEKLRGLGFRHVLPGHSAPAFDLPEDALEPCLRWMAR